MAIYEYRCERGHTFEVMQRMTEDPLASCTTCGAPVRRVFHSPAVHFKGSGFYTTDYGRGKPSDAQDSKAGDASSDSDSKPSDKGSSDKGSSDKGSSDSGSSKTSKASSSSGSSG